MSNTTPASPTTPAASERLALMLGTTREVSRSLAHLPLASVRVRRARYLTDLLERDLVEALASGVGAPDPFARRLDSLGSSAAEALEEIHDHVALADTASQYCTSTAEIWTSPDLLEVQVVGVSARGRDLVETNERLALALAAEARKHHELADDLEEDLARLRTQVESELVDLPVGRAGAWRRLRESVSDLQLQLHVTRDDVNMPVLRDVEERMLELGRQAGGLSARRRSPRSRQPTLLLATSGVVVMVSLLALLLGAPAALGAFGLVLAWAVAALRAAAQPPRVGPELSPAAGARAGHDLLMARLARWEELLGDDPTTLAPVRRVAQRAALLLDLAPSADHVGPARLHALLEHDLPTSVEQFLKLRNTSSRKEARRELHAQLTVLAAVVEEAEDDLSASLLAAQQVHGLTLRAASPLRAVPEPVP